MARPSGNPGEEANGVAMVQEAVDILEKALPMLPVGHPIHKAATGAISSLSKHAPPQAGSPGVGLQALKQLLASKMQQSPMAALLAAKGGAGAEGGAPPGMPGMPPPMPPNPGAGGMPMPSPPPMA